MVLAKKMIAYGTCVVPSYPVKRRGYEAQFELHSVPYTFKDHLADFLSGVFNSPYPRRRSALEDDGRYYPHYVENRGHGESPRIVQRVRTVAVLRVSKNGKPIHFEVWSPFVEPIVTRAHPNRFPFVGEFDPPEEDRDRKWENYKVLHKLSADERKNARDQKWKDEVLRRLQAQGKCIPEK